MYTWASTVPLLFVYVKVLYSRPKCDVLGNSHVPEEGVALEHHTDAALLHRYVGCIHLCSTKNIWSAVAYCNVVGGV